MGKKKYYAWNSYTGSGIEMDWNECQNKMKGNPGAKARGFSSYEEAWKFTHLDTESEILYEPETVIIPHGTGLEDFTVPADIPLCITEGVLDILGVSSLKEMSDERLQEIRTQGMMYESGNVVDYSERTTTYLLMYLPVNFYKIWRPLHKLSNMQMIPANCSILELGCGPGTATLSLITYFCELAKNNPEMLFNLTITSLERVMEYKTIYDRLTAALLSETPDNLRVSAEFIVADVFDNQITKDTRFDMIVESNMLNRSEGERNTDGYVELMNRCLCDHGTSVFIEPGTNEDRNYLESLFNQAASRWKYIAVSVPEIRDLDVSGIRLYNDTLTAGLRYKNVGIHWYSYGILMRKGEG